MPFPTVKSDPYKKGLKPARRRFVLWSDSFWKRLCAKAKGEWSEQDHGKDVFQMICDMNLALYGKA